MPNDSNSISGTSAMRERWQQFLTGAELLIS
jgi:hypothetical protein